MYGRATVTAATYAKIRISDLSPNSTPQNQHVQFINQDCEKRRSCVVQKIL
jgi:hypothetical protein